MKKFGTLIKILVGLLFAGVVFTVTVVYYLNLNVLKLKDHYPVWYAKTHSYQLVKKKPSYWLKQSLMSRKAKWAIIVSEDWAFYEHPGIDLRQLSIVVEESLEAGTLTRGASTITQQVIKNALLSNERSIFRKGSEIIMALLMERNFTKDEILEIYLNLIELGKGIYGVKAASYYYFKKPPSLLTAKEGAFLAMLLPSPVKYSHSFRQKKLTPFAKQTIDKILVKLKQAKIITAEELEEQRNTFLSFEKLPELLIYDDILNEENE